MRVLRKSLAEGAREARGVVVIIDVFRAFTCEPLFFHFGARRVVLEADPEKAVALKRQNPHWVLAGEVDEVPIQGGDLGNSPSEIILKGEALLKGKTIIHRTTAGVTGASAAIQNASELLLGSFLIAGPTAEYIRKLDPELVTLVAMGSRARTPAPEDEACADYLEHLLVGRAYDHVRVLGKILFQPTARKFILGEKPYLPREDPAVCLQLDLLDFALKVGMEGSLIVVSPT